MHLSVLKSGLKEIKINIDHFNYYKFTSVTLRHLDMTYIYSDFVEKFSKIILNHTLINKA